MKNLVIDVAIAAVVCFAWLMLSRLLHVSEFDRGLGGGVVSMTVFSLMGANRRRVRG